MFKTSLAITPPPSILTHKRHYDVLRTKVSTIYVICMIATVMRLKGTHLFPDVQSTECLQSKPFILNIGKHVTV